MQWYNNYQRPAVHFTFAANQITLINHRPACLSLSCLRVARMFIGDIAVITATVRNPETGTLVKLFLIPVAWQWKRNHIGIDHVEHAISTWWCYNWRCISLGEEASQRGNRQHEVSKFDISPTTFLIAVIQIVCLHWKRNFSKRSLFLGWKGLAE